MDSGHSADLSVKQKLLQTAAEGAPLASALASSAAQIAHELAPETRAGQPAVVPPRTLREMKEESLLHKAEKLIGGQRMFIAFYNETTVEDILNYSHNIRIVVACVQTLEVLAFQDFHEDSLEPVCNRRGKRHLMSAAREHELVLELWECLALQHVGQRITGITFAGMD